MRTVFEIWKSLRETGHCEGIEIADDIRESWARAKIRSRSIQTLL